LCVFLTVAAATAAAPWPSAPRPCRLAPLPHEPLSQAATLHLCRKLLIDALALLHDAALGTLLQMAGVPRAEAAAATDADPQGKPSYLYTSAALSLGLAAFRAPPAYRDLLGPGTAGSGGRSGQVVELVRRQYARAAAASMAEVGGGRAINIVLGGGGRDWHPIAWLRLISRQPERNAEAPRQPPAGTARA
jgi:hypothetical protein